MRYYEYGYEYGYSPFAIYGIQGSKMLEVWKQHQFGDWTMEIYGVHLWDGSELLQIWVNYHISLMSTLD